LGNLIFSTHVTLSLNHLITKLPNYEISPLAAQAASGGQYGHKLGEASLAKYRQPGYRDNEREPRREAPRKAPVERTSGPPRWDHSLGPKPVNLPGTRVVSRCAQCGTVLQGAASSGEGQCPKCGFELHSCKQCTYFDPGSRFECMQPVKDRVPKKDARNDCTLYEIRVTSEKETSTPASSRPNDARAAFENLFKK
jgi:predicted RNA-binding Zn-ribbon protein involved in translation (DUF1610 family)